MVQLDEMLKSADYKTEKHQPVIEAEKDGDLVKVTVSVGKEIAHPNTLEHHIASIGVFFLAEGKPNPVRVARVEFCAHGENDVFTEPVLQTTFKCAGKGTILASSYCNIHGLWEASLEI